MIVPMRKVYVVARSGDRDRLLTALRDQGAMHLAPIDPARAVAEEQALAKIDRFRRAIQVLGPYPPAEAHADVSVEQAAEEALRIQRESVDRRARLAALHRQLAQLAPWGELRREQFVQLREAGLDVRFYSVPAASAAEIQAECVQVVGEMPAGRRLLVGVVQREGEPTLPPEAEPLDPPQRDRPTIRAEAAQIDEALRRDTDRLTQLAGALPQMQAALAELRTQAAYTVAGRGGLSSDHLYAVQGWVPADGSVGLADRLAEAGTEVAVQASDPAEDELPPTLIRYPRWSRPIKGLFEILGTNPGYREFDLSGFFMVALPIFAAMIIGDAGYGVFFLALPLLMYRRLVTSAGKAKTHLLIVVGAVTIVWGVLTANYFGITPKDLMAWGGFFATLGKVARTLGRLWRSDEEAARFLIIKVSFLLGSVHLILAHVRQAVGYWPNPKAWSEVGWCAVLAGMLGVVWKLFKFAMPDWLLWVAVGALLIGYVVAVFMAYPGRSLGKRVGLGFASSLLPVIGTFGDTMSYIRLMAVGLASYYIATAFNGLGAMVAAGSPWLWLAGAPIILFGHLLNIGLAIIAIFAHGVRLNMLEFSNNAGVQWAGYPYEPFAKQQIKES